jgi:hypothetical protein
LKFRIPSQLTKVISLYLILILSCKPKAISEDDAGNQYIETSVVELETVSTFCSMDNLEDLSQDNFFKCPSNSVIGSQFNGTEANQPESLNLAGNPIQRLKSIGTIVNVIRNKLGGWIIHINLKNFNIRMLFGKKSPPNVTEVIAEVKKLSFVERIHRAFSNGKMDLLTATKLVSTKGNYYYINIGNHFNAKVQLYSHNFSDKPGMASFTLKFKCAAEACDKIGKQIAQFFNPTRQEVKFYKGEDLGPVKIWVNNMERGFLTNDGYVSVSTKEGVDITHFFERLIEGGIRAVP